MAIIDDIKLNIIKMQNVGTWRPLSYDNLHMAEQMERDHREGVKAAMAAYHIIDSETKERRRDLLKRAQELLAPIVAEKRQIETETTEAYLQYKTECDRLHIKPERMPGKGDLLDDLEGCFRDCGGDW